MLQKVDGKGGDAVESLQDIAPDFARYLIEFPLATFTPGQGWIYAAGKSPPSPRSRRVTPAAAESTYWRGIKRRFNAG
jgi:hypothetical protein